MGTGAGTWSEVVGHLDMDAFYVSVELRRRPELRGQAVVVAGLGPRSVVTTASYEARRFGVGSAMPTARARRLCPRAVFLPPDFPYYRMASGQVMDIVRSHIENVEIIGLDEAYLDLSGLPAPKAGMRRVVADIKASTGLVASVGIGPNKLVAKVASDAEKPNGFVVLSREQACVRFAESPCSLIPGIGHKTMERLEVLGIRTIAQLSAAPPDRLRESFAARSTAQLQSLARFEHSGQVTQERKVVSESRSRTLDVDVRDHRKLAEILTGLTVTLCGDLMQRGRRGRTIGISVRLADFSTHTRARTLSVPVNALDHVKPVALELLATFLAEHPDRPVRLLGVRVAGLEERREEQQLALAF
jgi:DNA polymerase-4